MATSTTATVFVLEAQRVRIDNTEQIAIGFKKCHKEIPKVSVTVEANPGPWTANIYIKELTREYVLFKTSGALNGFLHIHAFSTKTFDYYR
jgi:hypothetical protein